MRKRPSSPLAGVDTRWPSGDVNAAVRRHTDWPCCAHFVGDSPAGTPISH